MCIYLLQAFLALLFPERFSQRFGQRKSMADKKTFYRRQPKPAWVRKEVIRLKALMPDAGCRKVAHTFNRRFAESRQMTGSKTFVNGVIRKHNYEIQVLRRKIKNNLNIGSFEYRVRSLLLP
jgi:hypothetical protein